jgi:hypothetical protein
MMSFLAAVRNNSFFEITNASDGENAIVDGYKQPAAR